MLPTGCSRLVLPSQKQAGSSRRFTAPLLTTTCSPLLGWTPHPKRTTYRLVGTQVARDGTTNAQATLVAIATNTTIVARLGEKLDNDTTVLDIQPKQVTLEKGAS